MSTHTFDFSLFLHPPVAWVTRWERIFILWSMGKKYFQRVANISDGLKVAQGQTTPSLMGQGCYGRSKCPDFITTTHYDWLDSPNHTVINLWGGTLVVSFTCWHFVFCVTRWLVMVLLLRIHDVLFINTRKRFMSRWLSLERSGSI